MKNEVRRLRTERGWSQTELGNLLGVSRQTINAIENERYDPSLPLAFAIARAFGCAIEAIFDDGAAQPGSGS
jgi:putative transcriptional regulator